MLPGRTHQGMALAALLILLSSCTDADPCHPVATLIEALDEEGGSWGLIIRATDDGTTLYSLNAEQSFVPASNQKLLVTAAALQANGAAFRFSTRLMFQGTRTSEALTGDLVIVGSGDPSFASREFDDEDPLVRWAQTLRSSGVREIDGRIIGWDRAMDRWNAIDAHTAYAVQHGYMPKYDGLSYGDNQVLVRLAARPHSIRTVASQSPGDLLTLTNSVAYEPSYPTSVRIQRDLHSDTVRLEGHVQQHSGATVMVPVSDPTAVLLFRFKQALGRYGFGQDTVLLDGDALDSPLNLDGLDLLAEHRSPELKELVRVVNKQSNNHYAEQLFQTLGPSRSSDSAAVTLEHLRKLGVSADRVVAADGAGISRQNQITPAVLVELLLAMRSVPAAPSFVGSLPLGGEINTSLQDRLSDVRVRAKTGSLSRVRALSGYVTTHSGRELAFSILVNGFSHPPETIEATIDEIVRWAAER